MRRFLLDALLDSFLELSIIGILPIEGCLRGGVLRASHLVLLSRALRLHESSL